MPTTGLGVRLSDPYHFTVSVKMFAAKGGRELNFKQGSLEGREGREGRQEVQGAPRGSGVWLRAPSPGLARPAPGLGWSLGRRQGPRRPCGRRAVLPSSPSFHRGPTATGSGEDRCRPACQPHQLGASRVAGSRGSHQGPGAGESSWCGKVSPGKAWPGLQARERPASSFPQLQSSLSAREQGTRGLPPDRLCGGR